ERGSGRRGGDCAHCAAAGAGAAVRPAHVRQADPGEREGKSLNRLVMKLKDLLTVDALTDARFDALDVTGVAADSRTVKPGNLFVAIAGAKDDGLRFVEA